MRSLSWASVLFVCSLATAWASPLPLSPVVKTRAGKVRGRTTADGAVAVFLGIPYAPPPVGELRWKPPQPVHKWKGVRQAVNFGSRCEQPNLFDDMVFRDPGPSEDCLTLNVWTPAVSRRAHQPVMVWIFGGGFITGGTSEPRQDGEHLARKGVVVVSMNYRLGVFGFLSLPALAAESGGAAGDYGLMDQAAALAWVRQNIAAFGGDPGNVTIFGESAGSISVSAQMAAPGSIRLFQKAIGESGGAFSTRSFTWQALAASEASGERFVRSAFPADDLPALRSVPAEQVLRKAMAYADGYEAISRPNVDGRFLPEPPSEIYAAGRQAHVPLLAGWNRDEGAFAMSAHRQTDLAALRTMAVRRFGPESQRFLQVYGASDDAQARRAIEDFLGDRFIAYSTWAWLEAQAKTGGAPVFRYRFDLPSPGDPNHPAALGAFHSDDIEYVFGTLDSRRGAKWRPEDYRLSEQMQSYWTNFARTGDPNGPGLPEWPEYDAAGGWQVMHLGPDPRSRPDAHRSRYLFLQQEWREQENR